MSEEAREKTNPSAAWSESRGDAAVVHLRGEHDMATIDLVQRALEAAERDEPSLLVIDLSECRFADSTILRALLLAHGRASTAGRALRIVTLPDSGIARLLAITELSDSFQAWPTVEAALGDAAT
jgi:anti-sigma B factor antagonist